MPQPLPPVSGSPPRANGSTTAPTASSSKPAFCDIAPDFGRRHREVPPVREIMVFLHSHGVGTARAVRIYKTYGADAVQVMSENPYRLARDTRIAWAQAYPTRPVHIIVGAEYRQRVINFLHKRSDGLRATFH